jgi:hypothetical protein
MNCSDSSGCCRIWAGRTLADAKCWDPATLDRWLSNPSALVPGTKMAVHVHSLLTINLATCGQNDQLLVGKVSLGL